MSIIELTNAPELQALWLPRAESVHRELRPQLSAHYVAQIVDILQEGARMALAVDGDVVLGVALYRAHSDTFSGRKCYVDDLVTAEKHRSLGVGKALLKHIETFAKQTQCVNLILDSGTQRTNAHRFYFREGFVITSFNFKKAL